MPLFHYEFEIYLLNCYVIQMKELHAENLADSAENREIRKNFLHAKIFCLTVYGNY